MYNIDKEKHADNSIINGCHLSRDTRYAWHRHLQQLLDCYPVNNDSLVEVERQSSSRGNAIDFPYDHQPVMLY